MSQGNNRSANTELNELFDAYDVDYYEQALAFAKTPMLRKVYEIKTSTPYSNELHDKLNNYMGTLFSEVILNADPMPLYEPAESWAHTDGLYHLDNIHAYEAWDITRGP